MEHISGVSDTDSELLNKMDESGKLIGVIGDEVRHGRLSGVFVGKKVSALTTFSSFSFSYFFIRRIPSLASCWLVLAIAMRKDRISWW